MATTNGAVVASPPGKTRTRRRLWIAGLLAFGIAWAIAITYSVTAGGRSPERLTEADARTVNAACLDAQHALGRLRAVDANAAPADQAGRVKGEDTILTTMLEKIEAVHPAGKDPTAALAGWLGDWHNLVAAREHYASDVLTHGSKDEFVGPATQGIKPIAIKMNDWTLEQGTRTDRCNTGELQAEVVKGERIYGPQSKT